MLKLLAGAAVVAVAVAAGAVGAEAQTKKLVFALVPKNMNNPFFDQARDGCKKAEAESKGAFQCMYIGPGEHGGGEEQVQIVQDLVAKKVDGIAVAPANAAAMAVALQAAKGAGIPVLTWDSDVLPENKDLRLAYIGTHNYEIGVNLAVIGAVVIGSIGGLHWWSTKALGGQAKDAPAYGGALLLLLGTALVAIPDLASGIVGVVLGCNA